MVLSQSTPVPADTAAPAIERRDAGWLVTGYGYRAILDPDSWCFQPALGAGVPTTESLEFTIALTIARGDHERSIDGPFPWAVEGESATRLLAADVEEHLHLGSAGVEHSFLLHTRPEGVGDLRIAIELAGSLADAGAIESGGSVGFLGSHGGGVRVGGLVGIDALGQRRSGWIERQGRQLRYCLPADFVDGAAYPLLVDPWIGPVQTIAPTTSTLEGTNVSYHGGSDQLLYAWVVTFSSIDRDLLALRTDSAGQSLGSLIPIETGPAETTGYPSLTLWTEQATWLLLYRRNWQFADPFTRLRGVGITTSGIVGAAHELVVSPSTMPTALTAVGPVSSAGRVMFLTNRGSLDNGYQIFIHQAEIRLDAQGVPEVLPLGQAFLTQSYFGNIGVCRYPVKGDRRLAVITEDIAGIATDGQRLGLRLSNANGAAATLTWIDFPGHYLQGLEVAGSGENFRLVYKKATISITAPTESLGLFTRAVRVLGSQVLVGAEQELPYLGVPKFVYLLGMNFSGEGYQVLLDAPSGQNGVEILELDPVTGTPKTNNPFSYLIPMPDPNAYAPGYSGFLGQSLSAPDTLIVSYSKFTPAPLSALTYRSPGQVQDAGGGCGLGGQTFAHFAATGTYGFSPGIAGAEPQRPVVIALSATADPLACGPCALVPDLGNLILLAGGQTDALGSASWNLPIPINPALVGFEFYAQGAVLSSLPECSSLAIDLATAVRVLIE